MEERGSESKRPARLDVREVDEADLGRALELDGEYVGIGRAKFDAWRTERPSWLRGAYLGPELVGVCLGNEKSPGAVVLQTIGVVFEHWRKGIGTELLRDFEEVVAADGIATVSLGSAPDQPTESFYLKNGYRATAVVMRVSGGAERRRTASRQPDEVREDEDGRRLVFEVDEYDRSLRDELRDEYGADEAIFVFAKDLSARGAN